MVRWEEIMWAWKSRQMWILNGDRNTKYFHVVVKKHKILNHITRIKDDRGDWINNYNKIKYLVVNYFQNIFHTDDIPKLQVVNQLYKMFPFLVSRKIKFPLCPLQFHLMKSKKLFLRWNLSKPRDMMAFMQLSFNIIGIWLKETSPVCF